MVLPLSPVPLNTHPIPSHQGNREPPVTVCSLPLSPEGTAASQQLENVCGGVRGHLHS